MTTIPTDPCTCATERRADRNPTCPHHEAFNSAEDVNRGIRAAKLDNGPHVIAYAIRRRPAGLAPLVQWQCETCGRVGPWARDRDAAREMGTRHERGAQ